MPITVEALTAGRDALRRLPPAVKKAVKADVLDKVAKPLAASVAAAAGGPHGVKLAPTVKAKPDVDPVIKIGSRKVNHLLYGTEFGGGNRYAVYQRTSTRGRRHSVRRRVTRQFLGRANHPFIFVTFAREADRTYAAWENAVMDRLAQIWED